MDRVLGRLFSNHLGFQAIWVQVGSDFGSSDLRSFRVSGRSGSDRVSGCLISGHLRFRIVQVRLKSDSNQFDF
jgi:hypothetical protein